MVLLTLTSVVLLVITVGWLFIAYMRGKLDLFSYQVAFQAGMCVFFYIPLILQYIYPDTKQPYQPNGDGFTSMCLAMILFNIVYLLACKVGWKLTFADKLVPKYDFLPVSVPALAVMTVGMLVGSLAIYVLAFTPGAVGLFESLLIGLIPSLAAFATGLAVVLVLRQWYNALWYIILVVVFVIALLASISFTNDRRYALGVLAIGPWMLYFGLLRYRSKAATLTVATAAAVVAFSALAIYSGFRHTLNLKSDTVNQRVSQIQSVEVGQALRADYMVGLMLQDTPYNSIYFIENYPHNRPYLPLQGLAFFLSNPIPRAVFGDSKPIALGIIMSAEISAPANLGVGIIGHGWAEAGWIGVMYYAAFFGFFIGTMDRLIRARANNPYFLAAVGCNIGNVLSLPRGETSLFMLLLAFGFVGLWVFGWATSKTAGALARSAPPFLFGSDQFAPQGADDAYADGYEYDEPYGDGDAAQGPTAGEPLPGLATRS